MALSRLPRQVSSIVKPAALTASALAIAAFAQAPPARAAEPASCLSPNPADWPAPSRPYFMLAVDTSGSMTSTVSSANSCGYSPNDRTAHARCAVKNTVQAFGGEVNFGLSTFAVTQANCNATCFNNCFYDCFPQDVNCDGCGPRPGNATTRAGAFIRVPMQQDNFWSTPPAADETANLIAWVDNKCGDNREIFGVGNTPLNGILRDMRRYFATGWTAPDNSVSYPTPLSANDLPGAGVNGGTACRSVNVILLTDGDETCDTQTDAVNAASALYQTGVTVGGKTFKIPVYVINFIGGSISNTNAIAAAGGTGQAYLANNEVDLAKALANIVGGAIKPETCDNTDNNCNGCTDEGFKHYCDVQPQAGQCCTWTTQAQRTTCLNNYQASITPGNPKGDLTLLPCTSATQQQDPASWLCFDPGEKCDNVDNNCQNGVDDGVVKCGNPAHCPTTEVCNGEDDDCDGAVDEGVCTNNCVPSPEICDGCDNDCDGIADNGIPPIACGLPSPANCAGQIVCNQQPVPQPGACVPGGGFSSCNNSPQTETCDGIDNDCDGQIDNGVQPVACEVPGMPGLDYGPNSQCKMGQKPCNGTCTGYVGPSAEICDGIDNDCDGLVDETPFGVGQPCGINQPPCSPGVTACVNGALVCQGGTPPQQEVCDGVDNDCDGVPDDAPLADAPPSGQNGCWNLPGNCCTFQGLSWCPPPGGSCFGNGTLSPPCNRGTLACAGASGWVCQNPKGPSAEVCDGLDNDCNGSVDDGGIPQVGQPCGTNTGECQEGTLACTAGVLDCVNDIPPTPELCDGLDNDCDGAVDNGIPTGGPCQVPYDTMAFPGDRSFNPCQPGILQCDGMGGLICVGGVGPSAEVCDGLDNDCDGQVDEVGGAPDGINGTDNPFPPPVAKIGDLCGENVGECKQGAYACLNGLFACVGSQAPTPEICDCKDNDCDGNVDNPNPNGPALCGTGKDCIQASAGCQCAQPCASGEFPCPPGQKCEQVTDQNGNPKGLYCVTDPNAACGDCSKKTVKDANGNVLCAPAGTQGPDCSTLPVCECKGQNGCQEPCFGVTCGMGEVCAPTGPKAGQCVLDNCFNVACQGCGKVCNQGSCVDNPCKADTCPTGEVCKPSGDFQTTTCVKSCADVMCNAGEVCVDGVCIADCTPACAAGEVCDLGQMPAACVMDKCQPNPCTNGAYCDPVTGQCGSAPCEGVVCPTGQACQDGQCFTQSGTGGSGGTGGGGTTSSSSSSTSSSSTGAGGSGGDSNSIWGLATGGGGCSCEAGPGAGSWADGRLALLALALMAAKRRRQKRTGAGDQEVAS